MTLSKETVGTIVDLIENKLAMMHIGNRDDLREMVTLKRALYELRGLNPADAGVLRNLGEIPRRGRHRKVSDMIGDQNHIVRE